VFGVFGAALILARRLGGDVRGIATVIALNLVIGFMGANISWQGHLGGLLLGGAIAAVYAYAPPRKRQLYAVLAVSGVLLLVGLTVVLTVGLI
jgi:membrane associated rhomboid family serine protease